MKATRMLATMTLGLTMAAAAYGAQPLVIAHRGASSDAPENTVAAIDLAWKQGADGEQETNKKRGRVSLLLIETGKTGG